jgi:hypothetical protein
VRIGERWWRAAGLAFLAAAAYHLVAALLAIGSPSAWRHALFVAIDAGVAVSLAYRPPWLLALFAILTCQVIYSHGGYAWRVTRSGRGVAWFHWGVTLAVVVVLVMLTYDSYSRKAPGLTRGAG